MSDNYVSDKLINLLREFNELPSEIKNKVFVQAGMTDSEFDRLRIDVVCLEDDIEANIKDNQDLDSVLNAWPSADLLGAIFEDTTIDHDELNRILRIVKRENEMVVMSLVQFDDLSVAAQKRAIADHKVKVRLADKESGEKTSNITSDECREELGRGIYQFFIDGHHYDTDEL